MIAFPPAHNQLLADVHFASSTGRGEMRFAECGPESAGLKGKRSARLRFAGRA